MMIKLTKLGRVYNRLHIFVLLTFYILKQLRPKSYMRSNKTFPVMFIHIGTYCPSTHVNMLYECLSLKSNKETKRVL